MSILSDRDIKKYAEKNELIAVGFEEKYLTPNGYDLRVDRVLNRLGDTAFSIMSLEYLKIPKNMVASLYLKSRYCRVGVWGSFGFIDAGFEGKLQWSVFGIELEEMTKLVEKHMPMVQVVFESLGGNVEKSYAERSGSFQYFTIP